MCSPMHDGHVKHLFLETSFRRKNSRSGWTRGQGQATLRLCIALQTHSKVLADMYGSELIQDGAVVYK